MTLDLPPGTKDDSRIGEAGLALHRKLHDIHTTVGSIERIYYEEPITPSGVEGQTTLRTLGRTLGLAAHAESYGCAIGARVRTVPQGTWRRHFIGRGSGFKVKGVQRFDPKKMARDRCRALGWNARNNDESDALGLLDFAIHLAGVAPPWSVGGMFDLERAAQ